MIGPLLYQQKRERLLDDAAAFSGAKMFSNTYRACYIYSPMYHLTPLANGLRVASETLPGVESVSVSVSVGVGARHETEGQNGLSHLLEHMAFKGTKTRSARDIAESFDAIGGQFNA